jgi:hypothetical protein
MPYIIMDYKRRKENIFLVLKGTIYRLIKIFFNFIFLFYRLMWKLHKIYFSDIKLRQHFSSIINDTFLPYIQKV